MARLRTRCWRLVLVVALSCGVAQGAIGQQQPPSAIHVKKVEVVDRQGFGRPLAAFTMLVPTHWQTAGGVQWDPQNACNRSGYNFAWKAGLPDDTQGVAVLPSITWTTQPGGPCPQLHIGSAQDLLTVYAQQLMPGGQILDYRHRADIAKDLRALAYRQDYGSFAMERRVDAGELLVGYTENGRDMRASIIAQVMMWQTTLPAMYGQPGSAMGGGMSLPAFAAIAPAGQLDLRVAELIRKSVRPGPEWSREIARHHAVLNGQNRQHANRMAEINSKANSEISDIIHQGYRDRAAMRDRGQRETVEAIRGVETYNDPIKGGTVQLDNTYKHAWQLKDGSYVLTDDEFFNPAQTFGMDGQRLKVTR